MGPITFAVLALALVASALTVVVHPSPVKSAMALVTTLFLLAVVFVFLGAHMIAALQVTQRVGLVAWYASLESRWLDVEPAVRRLLMLRIHQWIVERVLTSGGQDLSPAVEDLTPGGTLDLSLFPLIPPGEMDDWRGWIQLVVVQLKDVLQWPAARQNEAWAHWLFLIPCNQQACRPPENTGGMPKS